MIGLAMLGSSRAFAIGTRVWVEPPVLVQGFSATVIDYDPRIDAYAFVVEPGGQRLWFVADLVSVR